MGAPLKPYLSIVIMFALTLTACGGGGGGGGRNIRTDPPAFTSFSAMVPYTPIRMQGFSEEVPYTWDPITEAVTSYGTPSAFGPTAIADLTVDDTGELTSLSFTSAAGTKLSFRTGAGDTFGVLIVDSTVGAAISAAEDKYALYARSLDLGWDYQTFGIWATETGNASGIAGTFSLGALTPVSSIPAAGTATYLGRAGGYYVGPAGTENFTVALMTAAANFGARTIAFNTTGTQQSADLLTFTANDNLNLSGTLTYAPGVNRFTGPISSVGGGTGNAAMTGTATGAFYGPAAEEIGGGFSIKGNGVTGYMGAFGGRR